MKASFAQEGEYLTYVRDDGSSTVVHGFPTAESVLVGRQSLEFGPRLVLFVYRSDDDALGAELGIRLAISYLFLRSRLPNSPSFFVTRRSNVIAVGPGAGEPLVVRTALAQLRCVPYC